VVRAEGYEDEVREIRLDQDIEVVLTLREATKQEPVPGAKKRSMKSVTAASARPPARCNPPYEIDDRGVKRYKTECL
jgi:hypothetical protein